MYNANYLTELVRWSNENVGFATIVNSVLTLLISIIAIIVSIRTARLPYKKQVKIETGIYVKSDGDTGLHVTAINCGNIDFTISRMGFIAKRNQLMVNLLSDNRYPLRLKMVNRYQSILLLKQQKSNSLGISIRFWPM